MASREDTARSEAAHHQRVLSRCKSDALGELAPLNTLLRRFATEAAREEARLFCDELVTEMLDRGTARLRLPEIVSC